MLSDRACDLARGRINDVELHESGETATQIAVQGSFERGPQLTRSDHCQLIEGSTSVSAQEQGRESPSVLGEVLFDRAATGRS